MGRSPHIVLLLVLATVAALQAQRLRASEIDEFRVKRQEVFEFTEKPAVTRNGDTITIAFESKGFCDATVAIEDVNGRIIRHLVSGVLGPKAPDSLQKNSLKQVVIWDGKNDKGEYVDDKDAMTVRVSLGLKPRYDKSLYWEPKKRVSQGSVGGNWTADLLVQATPEGVYVFDGNGCDHLRLFDHEGNYVRTIYPFPAVKLKEVKGLQWQDFPQGYSRPLKAGWNQTTFLRSGQGADIYPAGRTGGLVPIHAGTTMAVCGERIAVVKLCLTRLKSDGATGGLGLTGPRTWFPSPSPPPLPTPAPQFCPWSSAFSPDGKRLYLAGYNYNSGSESGGRQWLGGVVRTDYDTEDLPKTFMGDMGMLDGKMYTGVACDGEGRVYVSDYLGDQVLVHSPEGKLIKAVPVAKPACLSVHPKTGEMYVFSWPLAGVSWAKDERLKGRISAVPTLTVLGAGSDPKPLATYPLSWLPAGIAWFDAKGGTQYRATVDFWTDPVMIWLVPEAPGNIILGGNAGASGGSRVDAARTGILLLQPKDGKLAVKRDFGQETVKSVARAWNANGNQRIYVNPADGKVWVVECNTGGRPGSRFTDLLEIDPDTGKAKVVNFPGGNAEDIAFDIDGHLYLRQKEDLYGPQRLVRYQLPTWREIPWDYGEERPGLISVLVLPCDGTVCDDESGLWVSPRGRVAVCCSNRGANMELAHLMRQGEVLPKGTKYTPPIYPGRRQLGITPCVHVWDKHGKLVHEDAVPGLAHAYGVGLDDSDNLYVMVSPSRVLNNESYFNWLPGTLVKVKPGKSKWISDAGGSVPLSEASRPKRSPDLRGGMMGNLWAEGAEWFYGGVGNCSFKGAAGCHCWQKSGFTLDYFARTFAPEMDQFSVAALDTNGNLILRLGQYGNVDDGVPLVKDGRQPPNTRSIGGDEVSLMHACHVATLSDRFLYIGDLGNARIVKVKLGYNVEEKVALKNVPDQAANR